jgi:hypothetical protein
LILVDNVATALHPSKENNTAGKQANTPKKVKLLVELANEVLAK